MSGDLGVIAINRWMCYLCYCNDNKLTYFDNGDECIQHMKEGHGLDKGKIHFYSHHEWRLKGE